ncbi:MAG: alpha/beta hydrolase [Cyclobacteriaceae bacterium]|nr:alpha/beta hydrolase [Cyclobacteriaceae bacterium]
MKLLPRLLCLLLLSMLACSPGDKAFTDQEVTTKDDAFRKSVTTGAFVKLSQGYTYYEFENQDADTVLVMVHGFSVPSYIWDSTFYAAKQRGYGALRYDVFGRGYSDNPDVVYDAALFSGQLTELLDALKLTGKVDLMGLSYGGRIISAFAYQHPERVRNLIYVDPAGFETIPKDSLYPAPVIDEEITAFKKSDSYPNMAKGQMSDFYDSIPFAGWDKRYAEVMKFKGFVRALLSTRRNSPSMEVEHRKIADAGIPTFAFWGEHDTVVPIVNVQANLLDRLPRIELFILPKAGHLPHMEQTRMFNSILFDQILCCEH